MKIRISVFILTVCILQTAVNAQTLTLKPFTTRRAESQSFLAEYAGISAYAKVAVNMTKAEEILNSKEIDGYITGTLTPEGYEGYGGDHDVQIYVDRSGWILAYYSKTEHASHIIDWIKFDDQKPVISTKLGNALKKICVEMVGTEELADDAIKYYDFRYPDAENIMIVAEAAELKEEDTSTSSAEETFKITVPDIYIIERCTWSYAIRPTPDQNRSVSGWISIDEIKVTSQSDKSDTWIFENGKIDMPSGETRQFLINIHGESVYDSGISYGGIVLIYKKAE